VCSPIWPPPIYRPLRLIHAFAESTTKKTSKKAGILPVPAFL
jgi:hypothetical protein